MGFEENVWSGDEDKVLDLEAEVERLKERAEASEHNFAVEHAEVERLKALVPIGSVEQQKWMDLCDKASENATRSRKRAEKAEAEVERLKAERAKTRKEAKRLWEAVRESIEIIQALTGGRE